jgi:hypothetical protein
MQILIDLPGFIPFSHKGCNLAYNPSTGECYRQSVRGKWKKITPGLTSHKYTQLTIACKPYRLHRLIAQYFLNQGLALSEGLVVDHIIPVNGTAWQDRLANLRITTVRGNQQNQADPGVSKFTGVVYVPAAGAKPWRVRCRVSGRECYLGYYSTELEAAAVYLTYLKSLGLDTKIAEQKYWGVTPCRS